MSAFETAPVPATGNDDAATSAKRARSRSRLTSPVGR